MSICYMSGYGVKVEDIREHIKEDFDDMNSIEIIDYIKDSGLINTFYSEDDYFYIADVSPYEDTPFKSVEEINNYFFEKLKPILKENTTVDDIAELLDDVFDWDYC